MWNEKQRKTAHKLHRQSELVHIKERILQQRTVQESWQQSGMEGHGRRSLEQIWHMKKKIPTLCYECQTWTLNKRHTKKIIICEMKLLWKLANKPYVITSEMKLLETWLE